MPKNSKTKEHLLRELEEMRARLEEAEETLRAIRSGEVDALAVPGAGGDQVFTFKDADHSYRMLIEDMGEGALTLTAEGLVLYANRCFAGMLKVPLEKVIGSAIDTWIAPESQRILQSLLKQGVHEKRREELALTAGDRTVVPIYLSVSNLLINGMPDYFCLVATGLSGQKRRDASVASGKLAHESLAASNQSRLALLSVIEDQKEAEKALRESEEKYRSILHSIQEGYYELDLRGNFTFFNETLCKIVSAPAEMLTGLNPREHMDPKAAAAAHQAFAEVFRTGETVREFRHEIITPEGAKILLEASISPRRDSGGDIIGFRGTVRDITEGRRAATEILLQKTRFQQLMENSPVGIVMLDEDDRVLLVNKAFEKIFQFSLDELKGRLINEAIVPEAYKEGAAALSLTTTQGLTVETESVRQRKDGSYVDVQLYGVPIVTDQKPAGFYGLYVDITERKQARKALQKSEEHFRALIENAQDLIIVADADLRISYESPSVEKVLGFTREERIGRSVVEFIHPDDLPGIAQTFQEGTTQPGYNAFKEFRARHKDGRWRILEGIGENLLFDSAVGGIVVNCRDITERKRSEDALRESEENYRTILQSMREGYYEVDLSGNLTFFNDSLSRIVGVPADKLKGLSHREYTDPETANRVQKAFNGVFRTGEPLEGLQYEITNFEDVRKFIEASVSLRRDSTGQILGFRGTIRDITDRTRAEEALRESEDRYRDLVEHSHDLICTHDSTGLLLSANQSVINLLGFDREALLKMSLRDLLVPEFRSDFDKYLDTVRTCGSAHGLMKVQTAAGQTRIIEYNNTLRTEGVDEPIVRTMANDITERKQAETALRESEVRYRMLFDNNPQPMWVYDLETLSFLAVNEAAIHNYGYSREEFLAMTIRDIRPPEDIPALLDAVSQVTGETKLVFSTWRHRKKDGTIIDVGITSHMLDFSGRSAELVLATDITERKRATKELQESELKYRTLFNQIADPVVIFDKATKRFIDCNEAVHRNYGYSVEEMRTMSVFDLHPPEDLPKVESHIDVRNPDVPNTYTHITKEGRRIDVEVLTDEIEYQGRSCWISIVRDITERKRAEQALRESEGRYKTLFEAASDSIMIFEAEGEQPGRIVAANRAAAESTGYTTDELVSLSIADLQPPEQSERTEHNRHRIVEGEHLTMELIRRRKDGTKFPIEVTAGPLTLGGKHYILSFARDLTQRKHIEKEVTMLAHAIRSIREAVCITDAEDNLLYVNDAFLTTYGYERHEVIGENIFELVRLPANSEHDTTAIPPPDLFRRWEGELLNRRKDGSEFPIHLSTSPIIDEDGKTIALVGVTQDITESQRTITEMQKAKEAAEAASRAKSEFLANMSHEIRTPMNGIVGMTELALDTELTGEQREYLQLVKLSADSLLRVINDILDFSKIEVGKLELDFAEFSLQDSVDEVMKALAVRADQKGLELAYYLRPGVPDLIVGDAGRLRQILVNLVGNAIKFTERGEVVVRVEAESQTDDQVVLHFCVRDTGIGVPIEKQAVVFESFTQADGSTTRKYGGTGLGLAISTQLVSAMDGQIWIESPSNCGLPDADCGLDEGPGHSQHAMRNPNSAIGGPGSMFHFTAAFVLPKTSAARTAPLDLSTLRGLPALVVDDNATNRRILEVQLTGWGMIPLAAANAAEALNAIRRAAALRAPFRLALLDLHMPDVDGLELAEQMRRMPEAAGVKIIMMSSAVRENYNLQNRGIDAYLLKPVKASELLGVIRTVLGTASLSQNGSKRPRAAGSAHPARVLVAEDSLVNQELIKRLLTKWGHTAVIAENGNDALSLIETGKFDVVLMDLQMPELNGFEATAAIRERERVTGAHIPIIALTAHALKGDRERCIEAGMDDYISKPIEAEKLFDLIEAAASQSAPASHNGHSHKKALDIDAIVKIFDGDLELVLTLANVFASSSLSQLSDIRDAVARGDAEALAYAAHTLKGSVATFRAQAAVDSAARIERIGQSGDLSTAGTALAALVTEIERLRQELNNFVQVSKS